MDRPLKIDELLCFSVYSVNHAISRLYRPLLAPLGLTYPQYLVLVALWNRDRRKVNELGRELQLDTNTLTPLLKRMEAVELLTRQRNPDDERSLIVALTDKGRALEQKAGELTACVLDAMGGDIEELTALRDRLHLLRDKLERG
ncbi:MarR family winged helix-turn-helix transcriptional regulator [Epibacterium sp. Ofav1-8]|uniref:MarR family winged helix-turn-helix transcriptional regulator n=1 Tax=Epibacterium sp. Ofav1-8 TaxID=2917735 RepID=UPI001EF6FD10|nr:MarR family transcriptional regulator [Epibacterium sp. Ofav1-8]MCG7623685.1 MarR family transcriptional regulator [Epibacterium sp. Ofav1-8]